MTRLPFLVINLIRQRDTQEERRKESRALAKRAHEGEAGGERTKREERETRILNTAQDLLQKWGYRKTTLDDIAREAGIAKGTIYLSWPTRDKLFMAVVERAQISLLHEIARRMEQDPEGMNLIGLVKHSIEVTLENPVSRALVLRDTDFLGRLVHEQETATMVGQITGYMALLQALRSIGVVRDDVDLQEQAYSILTASWGPLLINTVLPAEMSLSDEMTVSIVVTTLKRLLNPDMPPSEAQRQAGEQIFRTYLEQLQIEQLHPDKNSPL